jgi:hypothetical protein
LTLASADLRPDRIEPEPPGLQPSFVRNPPSKELTMSENLFHAAMLTMFVVLSACSVASHSPAIARAREAVQAGGTSMPEPQAPFDTTPITPVESAGAARFE